VAHFKIRVGHRSRERQSSRGRARRPGASVPRRPYNLACKARNARNPSCATIRSGSLLSFWRCGMLSGRRCGPARPPGLSSRPCARFERAVERLADLVVAASSTRRERFALVGRGIQCVDQVCQRAEFAISVFPSITWAKASESRGGVFPSSCHRFFRAMGRSIRLRSPGIFPSAAAARMRRPYRASTARTSRGLTAMASIAMAVQRRGFTLASRGAFEHVASSERRLSPANSPVVSMAAFAPSGRGRATGT